MSQKKNRQIQQIQRNLWQIDIEALNLEVEMNEQSRGQKPFGRFIRGKRQELKLSLKDVAESLGVTVAYLSDIELGRRKPFKQPELEKLADVLNVPFKDLDEKAEIERTRQALGISPEKNTRQLSVSLQLARSMRDLSDEQLDEIEKIMNK